ncbi:MAG: DUF368 domain-containing protein [Acidobacteriota bacterium]
MDSLRKPAGARVAVRGMLGGLLMGLANLVPGISGGTMLLATGVYPGFIGAIAELTTLRFRPRSMLLLGSIAATAAVAILLLAGPTKTLVVEHRWIMYSLFIGLTLGGVPIVWRLARPLSAGLLLGTAAGLAVMLLMAFGHPAPAGPQGSDYGLLFLSGVAGAGAMILPGVSGGYLLLILGQYLPILGAIDDFKRGLLGQPTDFELLVGALGVGVPVGFGVIAGVVGVSHLLRYLLDRFEKATLGVLLGLLLGAVPGLWPFQRAVPPRPGDVIRGIVITEENAAEVKTEHWRTEYFRPDGKTVTAAFGILVAGLGVTLLIGRLERES